jgi:hypothetical protein
VPTIAGAQADCIFRRQGVGDFEFNTCLPNGDHLCLARHFPRQGWYAERTRRITHTRRVRHSPHCGCHLCLRDGPEHIEEWSVCELICRHFGHTPREVLAIAAPGVGFAFNFDGSFPVLAYMPYSEADLRIWPHLKNDIPEDALPPGILHT